MNIKSAFLPFASLLVALSVGSVNAKDIPGATPTSYGVSSSGAFQFSMPIVVPQGRNGVTPSMSLNFSSSQGAGALGVGWSVSGLSAISRCGKTVAIDGIRTGVQHSTADQYCLNGQRLILVAGSHGANGSEYRTEVDGFSKIVAYGAGSTNVNGGTAPTRWRVWAKSGAIYDYGAPDGVASHSAQFKLPGTNSIHSWKLARMSDRDANYYEATYRTSDGLVDEIGYTYFGATASQRIDFQYEANTNDQRSRYVVGSKINYLDRLSSVVVINNSNQVYRSYNLNYETAPITGRSRITSIVECGHDGSCMPSVDVNWLAKTEGYTNVTSSGSAPSPDNIAPEDLIEYETYTRQIGGEATEPLSVKQIDRGSWVDVNGDGELDVVIAYTPSTGPTVLKTYLRKDGRWELQTGTTWKLPRPLRSYEDDIVNNPLARFLPGVINMG